VTPRTLRLIAVPVLAALALAACGSSATPAASLGGVDLTDEQLTHEAQLFSFLSALNQQPCGGPPPEGQTQEAVCNRFALTNLIQERLIQSYASANDVSVTDEEVSDIVANLDDQLGKEAVDKQLAKFELTRADLTELARQVLLFQAVQAKIVEDQLGEEKLRALYDQDLLQFTTVQAEHILVDTKAEADDVFQQVTAPDADGKTFQDLATKVSNDTQSAQNGGSLGSAVASTYVPEFGQAVAALEPGEISEPVQTEFGWHVIRLVTKQVTPFDQAKQQLVQSQSVEVFNDWVRQQVEQDGLEVNPKYGRFDPETLSIVVVDSTDPSASAGAGSPSPVTATP
jgi:parvulin-like peptidyl-prolyl isomerase